MQTVIERHWKSQCDSAASDHSHRPFNETRAIVRERAGTRNTRTICRTRKFINFIASER